MQAYRHLIYTLGVMVGWYDPSCDFVSLLLDFGLPDAFLPPSPVGWEQVG